MQILTKSDLNCTVLANKCSENGFLCVFLPCFTKLCVTLERMGIFEKFERRISQLINADRLVTLFLIFDEDLMGSIF